MGFFLLLSSLSSEGLLISLAQLVNGVATLQCQESFLNGTAPCSLSLEGLPLPEFQANCKSAECIVASEDLFNGTNGEFR